nr:GTP cyclohydrolase 1-like [Nicotiana tomentosiformis]
MNALESGHFNEEVEENGVKLAIEDAVKVLLQGLGEDINREGYKQNVNDVVHGALFPEAGLGGGSGQAGGAGGLVIVRDLDLFSYCVAVVLQCLHIHFPNSESAFLDTSHKSWVKIQVSSGSGVFEDEKADIWADLFTLLNFRGISKENAHPGVFDQSWCPSQSCNKLEQSNSTMTNAVVSILKSLGEDPLRKELVGTPYRFLKWLMNFRNSNMEMKLNGFLQSRINSSSPCGKVGNAKDFICSELNLPFWSQCEHHLLPFQGIVHIGYFSSNGLNSIGRSELQSIVHFYGFKLQVQERLTR